MPNARNKSSVACLTVTVVLLALDLSRGKASYFLRTSFVFTSPMGRGRIAQRSG